MTDLNKLRQGLRCCINWENLKGRLPECESCPYADEREGRVAGCDVPVDSCVVNFRARALATARLPGIAW
jgi:hypothetical protein